jgi:hypothetical protein
VVVSDVLNQIVKQVPKAKPINVKHMEAVSDVLNKVANQVPKAKPINVKDTVAA